MGAVVSGEDGTRTTVHFDGCTDGAGCDCMCASAAPQFISVDHLPRFEYHRPRTLRAATRALMTHGGRASVMAGGTDLLRELKTRARRQLPEVVVSLRNVVPSLSGIEETDVGVRIGSTTPLADIAEHPLVRERLRPVADAAASARSWQYRNAATAGGELCQSASCVYACAVDLDFRCTRNGIEGCAARAGDARYHAVYTDRACIAACPSELAPALAALDATIEITGPRGTRSIPVDALYADLGVTLGPAEIITAIHVPAPDPKARLAYRKVGTRNRFDPSLVSVAAVVTVDGEVCVDARIAVGAVAAGPHRALGAEAVLRGATLDFATIDRAATACLTDAAPLSSNAYKISLARALVRRALEVIAAEGEV